MSKIEWIKEYLESTGAQTADSVPASYMRLNLYQDASSGTIVRMIGGRNHVKDEGDLPLKGRVFTVRMLGGEYLVSEYMNPDIPMMEQLDPHLRKLTKWFHQNIETAAKTKRFLRRVSAARNYFLSSDRLEEVQKELDVSLMDWSFGQTEYFVALAYCLFNRTKDAAQDIDRGRQDLARVNFAELVLLVECAKADGFQVDSSAQRLYDHLAGFGRSEHGERWEDEYTRLSRLCGPDAPDDLLEACTEVVRKWSESSGIPVLSDIPEGYRSCSVVMNPVSPAQLIRFGFRCDGVRLSAHGEGVKLISYVKSGRPAPSRPVSPRDDDEMPESLAELIADVQAIEKNAIRRLVTSDDMVALSSDRLQASYLRRFVDELEDLCNCMEVTELPCEPTAFAVLNSICRWQQFQCARERYAARELRHLEDSAGVAFTDEEKQRIDAFEIERNAWRQKKMASRRE